MRCAGPGKRDLRPDSFVVRENQPMLAHIGGSGHMTVKSGVSGKAIAEKAKAAGVDSVAFDRSGFKFHGRIKALADAAREAGLQF